jgi:hypothetical protein
MINGVGRARPSRRAASGKEALQNGSFSAVAARRDGRALPGRRNHSISKVHDHKIRWSGGLINSIDNAVGQGEPWSSVGDDFKIQDLRKVFGSKRAPPIAEPAGCILNFTGRVRSELRRWIQGTLTLMMLLSAYCAAAQGWPTSNPNLPLRNITVVLRTDLEPEPVAILRAKQVFRDFQRRGFFRIGALPQMVFEGLDLEIQRRDGLAGSLSRVENYLTARSGARQAIEVREFRLSFGTNASAVLTAHLLRLQDSSTWLLRDGYVDPPGESRVVFTEARLKVTGPRAGELVCETRNRRLRFSLLSPTLTDEPPPTHETSPPTNP